MCVIIVVLIFCLLSVGLANIEVEGCELCEVYGHCMRFLLQRRCVSFQNSLTVSERFAAGRAWNIDRVEMS